MVPCCVVLLAAGPIFWSSRLFLCGRHSGSPGRSQASSAGTLPASIARRLRRPATPGELRLLRRLIAHHYQSQSPLRRLLWNAVQPAFRSLVWLAPARARLLLRLALVL